jgi:hypothetical protein
MDKLSKLKKSEGAHANLLQAFMLMVVKQVKAQEKSAYIYIKRGRDSGHLYKRLERHLFMFF